MEILFNFLVTKLKESILLLKQYVLTWMGSFSKTINQEAIDYINLLHAHKIKTAVCSNNYEDNIKYLKKKFDLEKYFDVMMFSYEVGALKPDSKIYQTLIDRLNFKPEEIAYSDDREDKLEGAKTLYKKDVDKKFSFWAITKNIQRIRDTLENQGLPRTTITTVKGQGFSLIDK